MTSKPKDVTGSTEVAVREAAEAAVTETRVNDHISRYLPTEVANTEASRAQIHASIIEDIMSATSLDDVLTMTEGEDLESYNGRVIQIERISFNDSDFAEGPKVYVSIKGIDVETGAKFLINSGEQAIMAQVLKIQELATLPFRVRPMQSARMNSYGRYPMRLTSAKD